MPRMDTPKEARLPIRRTGGVVIGVFLALCAPSLSMAFQTSSPSRENGQAAPDGEGRVGPGPGGNPMREEIQETIEIYMVARMKRFLGLTDPQERVVIPLVEDLNASRRELNHKHRLTLMKLRPLVEEDAGADAEISRLVGELDDLDRKFRDKELASREKIRAALTPRQQGLFVIFMERFRQEMEDRLRRLQQGDAPGPGPGRIGPRRNPPPVWERPRR